MSGAPAAVHPQLLWPFLVYAGAVLVIVGGMVGLSFLLGQRHREPQTGTPYESGVEVTGTAHPRVPVLYYVVAMLFVVFDLEAVFLVAWAAALRESGWAGFAAAILFIVILLAVLLYEVRQGGFDFGLKGKDVLKKYREIVESGKDR